MIPLAGLILAACTVAATAGPITPPAGPVVSTPGPEPRTPVSLTTTPGDADSLFRIAAPGSYYLTGNISGVANKHGIELASGGIILDLNGFSITGNGSGSGNFDGITHAFSTLSSGVTIRNGAVTGWGRSGINLNTPLITGCVIDGVHATLNSGNGITAPADSVLSRCTASRNTLAGFSTSNGVTFDACTASANSAGGFVTGSGSIFRGCSARSNTGDGFAANIGCTFENCTATTNDAQYGFDVTTACTFTACVASQNTGTQSISAGFECQ
ncbi:MAG: right-handed parallel beta-helix repeat-containing protein, partial [Phycisphaerales bacterium]